jgi:hypothetical protein
MVLCNPHPSAPVLTNGYPHRLLLMEIGCVGGVDEVWQDLRDGPLFLTEFPLQLLFFLCSAARAHAAISINTGTVRPMATANRQLAHPRERGCDEESTRQIISTVEKSTQEYGDEWLAPDCHTGAEGGQHEGVRFVSVGEGRSSTYISRLHIIIA